MTDLKAYRINFHQGASLRLGVWSSEDPHGFTSIATSGFSFTNHAIGGFGRATIGLVAGNEAFLRQKLSSSGIVPDIQVEILLRCGSEPELVSRYQGVVSEIGKGAGTDPHRVAVECRGASSFLRQIPLFIATDRLTVNENVKEVNAFIAARHYVEAEQEQNITAGTSYTIRQVDFLDTPADRALTLLAKVAGLNVIHGFGTSASSTTPWGRLYFVHRDVSVLIMDDYSVGNGITVADAKLTRNRCINGALVRCQRKLGGGDLTLWIPPAEATRPWRVARLRMSETLDPAEAWEYGNAHRDEHQGVHNDVTYEFANLGRQLWPNEILNSKVRVFLTEDLQVYEDVWADSAKVIVKGDGSIKTALRLGEDRETHVAQFLGDLYHDVQVGDMSEFWTAAELAARDSDAVRDWRHQAAAENKMRNLWHAPIAGLESIVISEDLGLLGLDCPFLTSNADWIWDGDTNGVIGDGDQTVVYSVFVPSGRRAVSCTVYAELSELWYKASQSSMWTGYGIGDGFYAWSTSGSLRPLLHNTTATYVAEAHLLRELDANLQNSPVTIDIDRPHNVYGSITAPADFAEFVAINSFTDVFTAMQRHIYGDPFEPVIRYYGLRLIGISDGGAGTHVYCLLGWGYSPDGLGYGNLSFHSNYWDGPQAQLSSFFVSADEESDDYCSSIRVVFTLPAEENDWQTYGVTVLNRKTGMVLYEFSGTVVPFSPYAIGLWHPGAVYSGGGMEQRRPYAAGMWWEDYPVGMAGGVPRPEPHGIRQVRLSSSSLDAVNCGATRDGNGWGHGVTGQKFDLTGGDDTWQGEQNNGQFGVRVAVELPKTISMTRLGVAFKHDGEIE